MRLNFGLCSLLVLYFGSTLAADFNYDPYDYIYGPSAWYTLSSANTCNGFRQSPVNIPLSSLSLSSANIRYSYPSSSVEGELENNGHAAEFKVGDSGYTLTGVPYHTGDSYVLAQFHFHFGKSSSEGSEHRINGMAAPGEVHFVNYNRKYGSISEAIKHSDGLAVIGVLIQVEGSDSGDDEDQSYGVKYASELDAFLRKNLPKVRVKGQEVSHLSLNPSSILPSRNNFYFYQGSLTTPPCSEVVTWMVYRDRISLSQATFNLFRNLDSGEGPIGKFGNFRPVQELNNRPVFINYETTDNDK